MTRTLSERELNRALLARQLLLERVKTPLPRALERIGGIQAQYAPSMYIGLWSRLDGFQRDQLTRALERRSVIQGSMMRATIHLVSKRDYGHASSGSGKRSANGGCGRTAATSTRRRSQPPTARFGARSTAAR